MAKRRTDAAKKRAQRKVDRKAQQVKPGGRSKYARKHAYLSRNGKWGFEVPSPKPWGKE